MKVQIDNAGCTHCGICAQVCPNKVPWSNTSGTMSIHPDRLHVCFSCGHCMAFCPSKAIIVDGLSYEKDFQDTDTSQKKEFPFSDFMRSRRSVRNFRDAPVPDEIIEKILIDTSRAPMGFPPLSYSLTVINSREVIQAAQKKMITLYQKLYDMMKKPVMRFFIKKEAGSEKFKILKEHLIPLLGTRLDDLHSGKEDTITRHAPAMILFHGDRSNATLHDDALLGACIASLSAHAHGLGATILDIIPPAVNKTVELRKLFDIPENHDVVSSLILGYPKFRQMRMVKRDFPSVNWIR